MSEHFKHEGTSGAAPNEPELVVLIKKMQQHLVFLEKKIDTLISQSSERPFKGKRFSKPFRPGGHFRQHAQGEHGNRSGERNFSQGRPFDQPQGEQNRGLSQRKKPFFHRRKDRS